MIINDFISSSETLSELFERSRFWEYGESGVEFIDSTISKRIVGGDVIEIFDEKEDYARAVILEILFTTISPSTWHGISLNGKEMNVIYINTGRKFSMGRLVELFQLYYDQILEITEGEYEHNKDDGVDKFIYSSLLRLRIIESFGTDHLRQQLDNVYTNLEAICPQTVFLFDHICLADYAQPTLSKVVTSLVSFTKAHRFILFLLTKYGHTGYISSSTSKHVKYHKKIGDIRYKIDQLALPQCISRYTAVGEVDESQFVEKYEFTAKIMH